MSENDQSRIAEEFNHWTGNSTDPFASAVRATRMPMVITDPRRYDNPIVFCNDAFVEMTGYPRDEMVGRNCRFLQGPDTAEAEVAKVRQAIERREGIEVDVLNYRKDGTPFWNALLLSPVFGDDGELTYFFASQIDVTERKRTEMALREQETQLRVMVAELHHRTRNLLGIVGTLARRLVASSSTLGDFQDRFTERLDALSRVQGILSRKTEGRIDLGEIVRLELDALGADLANPRIIVEGEAIALRRSTVQMLSLAIHELATNAQKYGALQGEAGRLVVRWDTHRTQSGERRLRFAWTEAGIDRMVEETEGPMHRGGYGRELIEQALPYALKATTTYTLTCDRLDCTIDLPLDV